MLTPTFGPIGDVPSLVAFAEWAAYKLETRDVELWPELTDKTRAMVSNASPNYGGIEIDGNDIDIKR